MSWNNHHNPYLQKTSLEGSTLKIVGQYDPKYEARLSIREYKNGTIEFTDGMCLDILLALQVSLNFSYLPKLGSGWISRFSNGHKIGLAAQIVTGEADLSIAQSSFITIIQDLTEVSVLHATTAGKFVALFRQPPVDLNLLGAISWKKCLLILISWILLLASIFVFAAVYKKHGGMTKRDEEFIHEAILWTFAVTFQKCYMVKPESNSFRIICLAASFLAIWVYASFSATLTSNLALEEVPIKSFNDLRSSNLELYSDKLLPTARNLVVDLYKQRGAQIPENNSDLHADEGMLKTIFERTQMAFVTFADAVSSVFHSFNKTDDFFCRTVSTVHITSVKSPAGMFVKRASPLKEILNKNILRLTEVGIIHRVNRHFELKTEIQCPFQNKSYRGGLFMADLKPSYYLLCGYEHETETYVSTAIQTISGKNSR